MGTSLNINNTEYPLLPGFVYPLFAGSSAPPLNVCNGRGTANQRGEKRTLEGLSLA
jgi:hypothetical protein